MLLLWQHHLHLQSLPAAREAKPALRGHLFYDVSSEQEAVGTREQQYLTTFCLGSTRPDSLHWDVFIDRMSC